jgi:uncharacterized protein with HEPN domain
MRSDRDRLLDIVEAIERIHKHADVDKPTFEADELIQTWMVYNIQIIGEAAASVSPELRAKYPETPWRAIALMRNAIVHAYFRVDLDEVWNVIKNDIPSLESSIRTILAGADLS